MKGQQLPITALSAATEKAPISVGKHRCLLAGTNDHFTVPCTFGICSSRLSHIIHLLIALQYPNNSKTC